MNATSRYEIVRFDPARYDFVGVLRALFGVDDLGALHERHLELFKVGDDSKTSFHQVFYDRYRDGWPEMETLYESLIAEVVAPDLGESSFLYQKFPTFRVHLRQNVAVGAFHTDAEFGHPAGEINYVIPLTQSTDTASIWVESVPGRGDFEPMRMEVGGLLRFNGNILRHGNKVNLTNAARLSMDFRVLPLPFSKYVEESATVSMTRGTKFVEGAYYKRFTGAAQRSS